MDRLVSLFRPQAPRPANPEPRSKREEGSGVGVGAVDDGNTPEAEVKVHPGAGWSKNEGSMLASLQTNAPGTAGPQFAAATTPTSTTMGEPGAVIGGRLREA